MRSLSVTVALAIGWTLAGLLIAPAQGADLTVFAAASVKEALDEQVGRFRAETGDTIVVSYGGSNALARQVEAGAPADIFLSADTDWIDYLDQRHLLRPGTRTDLLRNRLVLIAPAHARTSLSIRPGYALGPALGSGRLAMVFASSTVPTSVVWVCSAGAALVISIVVETCPIVRATSTLATWFNTSSKAE